MYKSKLCKQIHILANNTGLSNKIDPLIAFESEDTLNLYIEKLTQVVKFQHDLNTHAGKNVHLMMNPRLYVGTKRYQTLLEQHFSPYADLKKLVFDKFYDEIKHINNIQNPCEFSSPVYTDLVPTDGTRETRQMFICDVDWEYINGECFIILYCKDIKNTPYTLLYEFMDYFYVDAHSLGKQSADSLKVLNKVNNQFKTCINKIKKRQYKFNVRDNDIDVRKHWCNMTLEGSDIYTSEIVTHLKNSFGYQNYNNTLYKFKTKFPYLTTEVFRAFSSKPSRWDSNEKKYVNIPEDNWGKNVIENHKFKFYECDYGWYILKFMAIHNIAAFDLIEVDVSIEPDTHKHALFQGAQVLRAYNIKRAADQDTHLFTPIKFFFDIECITLPPLTFPEPESCPIIQISVIIIDGNNFNTPLYKDVLCFKETPGYEWFHTEEQMLIRFFQLIRQYNVDFLIGYNSNAFDMPYIIKRAKTLGLDSMFLAFSKRNDFSVYYVEKNTSSNQKGDQVKFQYTIPGRTMFDIFPYMKDNEKLEEYSLNGVAFVFLQDENKKPLKKEDLQYGEILPLFGTIDGRVRIASYCLQDSNLCVELDRVRLLSIIIVEMTKILGCTLDVNMNRGVIFKIMRKMMEYTIRYNFVLPTFNFKQRPVVGNYTGAVVLDPVPGFHTDCVSVLDFKSLYPSIICGWNLSMDTWVIPNVTKLENGETVKIMPKGDTFVTKDVHVGILSHLESELMKGRDFAKKQRKQFPKGSMEYNVYDAKQVAIKVVCNSVYGGTGSKTANKPLIPIARSITSQGQRCILKTKKFIENNYYNLTGADPDKISVEIVYGDTDSVFIKHHGLQDVPTCAKYSELINDEINKQLWFKRPPMELEYEKTLFPLLLLKKKKYISMKYQDTVLKSKAELSYAGVEMNRRDGSPICLEVMNNYVKQVFQNNDRVAGLLEIEKVISKLLMSEYPLESFKLGKKISRENYVKEPGHIKAWKKMQKRIGKDAAPKVGDRFFYIYGNLGKVKNRSDNIVDFVLAQEEKIGPDIEYYLEASIILPMGRILEYIEKPRVIKQLFNIHNYDRKQSIYANKRNLLGYFGKKHLEHKIKKYKKK